MGREGLPSFFVCHWRRSLARAAAVWVAVVSRVWLSLLVWSGGCVGLPHGHTVKSNIGNHSPA